MFFGNVLYGLRVGTDGSWEVRVVKVAIWKVRYLLVRKGLCFLMVECLQLELHELKFYPAMSFGTYLHPSTYQWEKQVSCAVSKISPFHNLRATSYYTS